MIQEKMESIVLDTVEAFGAITEVLKGLLHCNRDCKCGMWYNLITEV